jgi:UDPglucose 6-dehydrogenase
MEIAVIGSGYVGLVAAACFAEIGHTVTCVDNDQKKLSALQRGEAPIHELYLPELLQRHRGNRLRFSASVKEAVEASSVVFIAVGTPPLENGDADLSYVETVAREIALSSDEYKLVVEKSTVPVYTSEWIRRVMKLSRAKSTEFDVASNPEFLREGTAVTDFLYPDRIVIGADNDRSRNLLEQVYRPLIDGTYYQQMDRIPEPAKAPRATKVIVTSAKSAELIKHASNAFLAMKISFINAVANVCESVQADIEEVRSGIGADSRIGNAFLSAGIGYGGSCFPKDVAAFRTVAQQSGCSFPLLDDVIRINSEQRNRFIRKVREALWTLKGKRLAVLGLSFKGGTDDIRESPAIEIVKSLIAEQCSIRAYDPAATSRAREVLNGSIFYATDAYEAAESADALVVLTDWEDFADLDFARIKQLLRYPIVIDGRNLYSPEMMKRYGFMYVSVGRPTVQHNPLASCYEGAAARAAAVTA